MLREAWYPCPTCGAEPGWPCTCPDGQFLTGVYHDLDDAVARDVQQMWDGRQVCLACLELRQARPHDVAEHCACTRYAVPAPDHVEARLPNRSLCILCATGVAGGPTRWAVLACRDCREMDARIAGLFGLDRTGLPLGRHSIMNGAAIRVTDAYDPAQGKRLAAALNQMGWIQDQGRARARAIADQHFPDRHGAVPLWEWQQALPPGPATSLTALMDLLGPALPTDIRDAATALAVDEPEE